MTRGLAFVLFCAAHVGAMAAAPDPMQYGRAYLAEGDHAAAIRSYAEALRVTPFDPVALNNMGVAKAAAGDYQSAIDFLTRAQKLAPERSDIQENLANLQGWARTYGSGGAGADQATAVIAEPPALWQALPRQADMPPGWQLNPVCSTPSCK